MKALISVSDKTGIVEFAQSPCALGVQLLSTGGTAKLLAGVGLPVTEVAEVTRFPEMLDGRVKTLQPHGARWSAGSPRTARAHGCFEGTRHRDHRSAGREPLPALKPPWPKAGCTLADAIENIDIGGPAMVRSAAKNWKDVGVLTAADQYDAVLAELKAELASCPTSCVLRCRWLRSNRIAQYDGAISDYLSTSSSKTKSSAKNMCPSAPCSAASPTAIS